MEQFMAITGRNLKTYFRDRGAVLFSLLSMIIVIVLMVFFLGDMNIEELTDLLGMFSGRDAGADKKHAELLVLIWTCGGILSINGVTVTLSAYSVMIKDRVTGKLNSIYTAPVSRGIIAAGYVTAAWVASVIMCSITLAVTEIYCVMEGMQVFPVVTHVQLFGMIMVNSFVYATLMYLLAMLAKTEGAWSGIGTVIGTLVGFLGGIYIPVGSLSPAISGLMKCTPVIYGTAMFRDVMTRDIMKEIFADIPEEIVSEYRLGMGMELEVFDRVIGITEEWLMLLGCGIILLIVGIFALKYSKKTDR